MSTAQRQTGVTVFRTPAGAKSQAATALRRATVPARERVPAAVPRRPAPTPEIATRPRIQAEMVMLMMFTSLLVVLAGLVYLSGYARVTQEAYRRVYLKSQLRHEHEMAQYWKERQAALSTPTHIEHAAAVLGMAPADEHQTVTLK